jgi:hypothetical protein
MSANDNVQASFTSARKKPNSRPAVQQKTASHRKQAGARKNTRIKKTLQGLKLWG